MPLVAHYPLDEDSGSTATDVAGSNDGTINGATLGATGILGTTAYSFDGTDDHMDSPTMPTAADMGTHSVSIWANADLTDGTHEALISYESTDWVLYNADSDEWEWWLVDEVNGATRQLTGPAVVTGVWTHIVCVWDGSDQIMYVDGVEAARQTPTMNLATVSSHWEIGNRTDGNFPFQGDLDEFRIYDHALTPQEVQFLYSATKRGDYLSSVKTST